MLELTDFERMSLNGAENALATLGKVPPALLALVSDKVAVLDLAPLLVSEEGKAEIARLIQGMRTRVDTLVFVVEIWMVAPNGRPAAGLLPVREQPDKIEAVLVSFYYGIKMRVFFARIKRIEGCQPCLGTWEETCADGCQLAGTFCQPPEDWN